MRVSNNYWEDDTLYFYGKMIDDCVKNKICSSKKEATVLIKDIISCGVNIWDNEKVMFLFFKLLEIKNSKNLDELFDYLSLNGTDNKFIVNFLIDKYFSSNNDNILYEECSGKNNYQHYIKRVRELVKKNCFDPIIISVGE